MRLKLFEHRTQDAEILYTLDKNPMQKVFPIHMHETYELYCFISGDAGYMVEGREYSLDYGSVLLMRPGELHRFFPLSDAPYERYVVNFSSSFLPDEIKDTLLEPFRSRPLGEGNLYRGASFSFVTPKDLLAFVCSQGEQAGEALRAVLPAILTLLRSAGLRPEPRAEGYSPGAAMIDFVNEHLCDPVTLSDVTEHFHLSTSQVTRIFRAATGTTVGQYCLAKRLMKARRRILSGMPIQQAATQCGFSCYSSFFRLYKKQFGVIPSSEARTKEDSERSVSKERQKP